MHYMMPFILYLCVYEQMNTFKRHEKIILIFNRKFRIEFIHRNLVLVLSKINYLNKYIK